MTGFHLPDVGEGLQEAEIIAWHVGPGDHVVGDQPLVAIETDKAVVEIPSPRSGHIARLCAEPGDIIEVGALLVEFADDEATDAGAIVGEIQRPSVTAPTPSVTAPIRPRRASAAPVQAAPAVRERARRLGLDLATVTPTGAGGTISMADLDNATVPRTVDGAEPLRGVRRSMATNMAKAHDVVVPATVTDEADVGDWRDGEDVTLRLVRAVAAACAAEPALNAWFHGRDEGITRHDVVDLGIAMDAEDGLFVPVLRDVGTRSAADLRAGLDALKADVSARSVPPAELKGQTITLSNFGVFGGLHAALVVVPPQVAIIGAGRTRQVVVAHDGAPAIRPVLPLSLTFDHRVVMGGEAARFLGALVKDLEAAS